MNALVKRFESINRSKCKRGRGRPKKSGNKVIKYDLNSVGPMANMAPDRSLWKSRIKVAYHM